MIVRKEWVDENYPDHACVDHTLGQARECGFSIVRKNEVVIERKWEYMPKCLRCYLLDILDKEVDDNYILV